MAISNYFWDLEDAKIAPWQSAGTYGTALDVGSVQRISVRLRVVGAELRGDGQINSTASKIIGAGGTMRWGKFDLEVFSTLFASGRAISPDVYERVKFDGRDAGQYVGIVGRIVGDAGGYTHLFLPKVKVMGDVSLEVQEDQYAVPELELMGVADDTYGAAQLIRQAGDDALTIPPLYAG